MTEEILVQMPSQAVEQKPQQVAVLEVALKSKPDPTKKIRFPRTRQNQALIKARKRLEHLEKQVREQARELTSQTAYLSEISELQGKINELEEENLQLARLQQQKKQNQIEDTEIANEGDLVFSQENSIFGKLSFLTNIWTLRTLATASGIILSSLLLAYSFIFLNTFVTSGSTTSFFPWSWNVSYNALSSVQALFYGALGISLILLAISAIMFWYCLPKLLKSL